MISGGDPMSDRTMDRRTFVGLAAAGGAAAVESRVPALARGVSRLSAAPFELEEATIAELQAGMKSGKYTARGLTAAYAQRIDALDRKGPALRAVLEVNPDALAQAEALDAERKAKGPRRPHAVGLELRLGRGRRGQPVPGGDRDRDRRVDRVAVHVLLDRGHQAHARAREPHRDHPHRAQPGHRRADGAHGGGRERAAGRARRGRSPRRRHRGERRAGAHRLHRASRPERAEGRPARGVPIALHGVQDRKSTRLNSSHRTISYAVFCLKKKKKKKRMEVRRNNKKIISLYYECESFVSE